MARNLSWIDPEKLASLLDVVSPTPPASDAGEHPSDDPLESALFAPTSTGDAARQAPAAKPAPAQDNGWPAKPSAAKPLAAAPRLQSNPTPPAAKPAPAAVAQSVAAAPAPLASVPAVAAAPAAAAPAVTSAPAAVAAASAPVPAARAIELPAAFQPSRDADLGARFEAFLDWVVSVTQSRGVLIADAHGFIVVERRASEIEPTMTTSVDLMLNHVADVVQSDLDGYVTFHRKGLHLVTLWTPTAHGRFFGVLIGETAPPQESIALAGQGLRTLFAN
jgi:hypothetical protein